MRVQYRDTRTGETAWDKREDLRYFDLVDNNWSCDCNRRLAFDQEHNLEHEYCLGCKYYVVSDIDADISEGSKFRIMRDANKEYPNQEGLLGKLDDLIQYNKLSVAHKKLLMEAYCLGTQSNETVYALCGYCDGATFYDDNYSGCPACLDGFSGT